MNREFWLDRWAESRIGFHKPGVNPLLERFWPQVAPGNARTLVPLCGKSADLMWLAARGDDVVGVELSEIAARSFASEQGVDFVVTQEPPFVRFDGGRGAPTLLIGDLFDLTPERIGRFDLVYDRAALIAMPGDRRPAYAHQIASLLAPESHTLLVTLEYDETQIDGPPFSVPEAEVRRLFSEKIIEKLDEYDCLDDEPRFRERGLTWMKEAAYHLR